MSVRRPQGSGRGRVSRAVGVCDLGTYSALILIAAVRNGRLSALLEERHTIDLTRHQVEARTLSEAAGRRAARVLRRFDTVTRRHDCIRAAVVGTAALRAASNRAEVLERLQSETRWPVIVLPARAEVELAVIGARSGFPRTVANIPVIDIGGGSIEVIDPAAGEFHGFRIGAATATSAWSIERPWRRSERAAFFRRMAYRRLRGLRPLSQYRGERAIGVGGTLTALAAIVAGERTFDPSVLHGWVLHSKWIAETAVELAALPTRDIAALIPFDPARARVLTAGTFLWAEVIRRLCIQRVIISVRGVRWGAAVRLAAGRLPARALRTGDKTA